VPEELAASDSEFFGPLLRALALIWFVSFLSCFSHSTLCTHREALGRSKLAGLAGPLGAVAGVNREVARLKGFCFILQLAAAGLFQDFGVRIILLTVGGHAFQDFLLGVVKSRASLGSEGVLVC
jgi:hypothetical protein